MGLGYIGLPTAIIAAKHGIQIMGVDINPQVVEMTNAGHLHIIEPGMEEMLQEVVNAGSLKASIKPEVSDAYFMVVPTPFKGNHEPDTSYVEAATRAVLPLLKKGDLYVIESTSPVGTTEAMSRLIFLSPPFCFLFFFRNFLYALYLFFGTLMTSFLAVPLNAFSPIRPIYAPNVTLLSFLLFTNNM